MPALLAPLSKEIELYWKMAASQAYSNSSGGTALPGVNPGFDPRGQKVIPRRFKQKKICDARTNTGWTDRRDS